ncbi:hypothetical protein A3C67_02395 [Candidatus Nomurabacteria bacterium RIFCSPHIGHO2_02_FULL_42_19]|uniref:Uncharacterized protein n=1 Tax=Candidatus Nomurabacteria bacterium RIFCSPHIGHO2_02_FULL_42_19 TaxID=1801756 RepID=A0A1F6W3H6_9BACT|nr:MAG: hypothetical protein A3C67_02395 [Candidatus Nomurabacteria bacterium RIFCSPHIGHO2_02_FULL_42_19]
MCYTCVVIRIETLITSAERSAEFVRRKNNMKKRSVIFLAIVAPSTATMILSGIHPGWIVSNLLWFVVLAAAHKFRQEE